MIHRRLVENRKRRPRHGLLNLRRGVRVRRPRRKAERRARDEMQSPRLRRVRASLTQCPRLLFILGLVDNGRVSKMFWRGLGNSKKKFGGARVRTLRGRVSISCRIAPILWNSPMATQITVNSLQDQPEAYVFDDGE